MSILSSTGSGLYNMPLNDNTLQLMGYNVFSMYTDNLGYYIKTKLATHDEFTCNLQNYLNGDNRWFTIIHQKMSTSLGPCSGNGIHHFMIYFETTGQLKEFERYFRIKDDPSYTDEQKEQLLCYFFEHGYKFLII